ncbi:MAG: flavin reductase family protein [Planctomycetota bacterium]
MAELSHVARALARIPSGLFVLSAGRNAPIGLLVSFVQQVGFDPPAVAFALKKGRDHVLELLRRERAFCLSVVPEGHKALLGHFAAGFPEGTDPFAGIEVEEACNGVRFPRAACAHLACELVGEADWSDHLLLCGHVVGGAAEAEAKPWVHLRKNGLGY